MGTSPLIHKMELSRTITTHHADGTVKEVQTDSIKYLTTGKSSEVITKLINLNLSSNIAVNKIKISISLPDFHLIYYVFIH
jgi:hypothetical protein